MKICFGLIKNFEGYTLERFLLIKFMESLNSREMNLHWENMIFTNIHLLEVASKHFPMQYQRECEWSDIISIYIVYCDDINIKNI